MNITAVIQLWEANISKWFDTDKILNIYCKRAAKSRLTRNQMSFVFKEREHGRLGLGEYRYSVYQLPPIE